MTNWRRVDEIITYHGKGVTPKYVDNSSIIVLNQKCIRNNKIDFSFAQYIDDSKTYNDDKFLKIGDILVNSTGQGTAGRVALVECIPENYKLIIDSHILVLRTDNFSESKCLNYALFSIESMLQGFMDGSTGQGEFDKIRLFNVNIGYSKDKVIQQKITSVLSSLDDKIELNTKINIELEQMAKAIYDYWFVQFDFPDTNGNPYKSSGGKMVCNEELKREIPEDWEVKNFGKIFEVKRGTMITRETSTEGNYKVVAAGLNYSYLTGEFNRDEFTITVSGSGANAGYVNFWMERIFASDCTTVRGENDTETFIGLYFLKMHQKYIFSQAKGSAQPHIYPSDIDGLKFVFADEETRSNFGNLLIPLYEKVKNITKQNQELARLRDWLLPMLMNGQVTVGDAEEMIEEKLDLTDKDKKIRRKMLATYIINQSLNDTSFGKTKFEKLLHLIECHIVKGDYNQRYSVQAAGPYDGGFTKVFWNEVTKSKWFKIVELGKLKRIIPAENHTKSLVEYDYFSDNLKLKISDFIAHFSNTNYERPEIVSTLYAVWNNRIIRNEMITDELLKKDFLDWDTQKARYENRLYSALEWMRENAIVPDGWGKEIRRAKK